MKIKFYLTICGLMLLMAACKKDKTEGPVNNTEQPSQANVNQAEDNNDLKSEGDQVNTDVTDALEKFSTINGRVAVTNANKVCGCSIDSIGSKTIRLSYDGVTPCGNPSRTRAGKITIQLVNGNRWHNQNAVLKITLENYTVTRLRDSKSWTFNGDKYYTNLRGTNWLGFLAGTDSLLYRERATNMLVLFSSGASITYNIARTTTWSNIQRAGISGRVIQFAANGDTTLDGLTNVDTWGTNRFGKTFTSNYLTRFVSDNYCWFWRPRSGEIQHKADGNTIKLKMGVNEAGISDTRDCAYGWKLNWNLANGGTGEKIFSY